MRWSLNIGRLFGTTVRLHVTFLLFLAWIFAAAYANGGAAVAWNEITFILLVFLFVLAHEFGHILVARAFHIPTADVTLLPIGGVARLERISEIASQELLIALAGPAVNVVIAIALIFLASAHFRVEIGSLENSGVSMVDRLVSFNLLIAAFNIIPAFPMDGGRVLRAALATRLGYEKATAIAAAIGQWLAFVLGFAGLIFNPMLIFIAIFVYLAAAAESQSVALRGISRGIPATAAMMTRLVTLGQDSSLEEATDALLRTSQSEFPVIDNEGKLVGILERTGLIEGLKKQGLQGRVSEVMATGIPTIESQHFLEEAFRLLEDRTAPAVGVVDAKGRLLGLVTFETIGEMLMLSRSASTDRFFDRMRSNQKGSHDR